MPTTEDLQDALQARERHAGDADAVLARLATPPKRHRTVLAVAASVVAVAALAAGATHLVRSPEQASSADGSIAPPAGGMRVDFAFANVPGFMVLPDGRWQYGPGGPGTWTFVGGASIAATDGPASGSYVHSDAPPTAKERFDGEPVTIAGRPGIFAPGTVLQDVDRAYPDRWQAAAGDGDAQPRLRWQEPDGSWSYLSGTFGFRPEGYDYDNAVARVQMITLASAVTIGTTHPLTLPLQPAPLPRTLWATDTIDGPNHPCVNYADRTERLTGDDPQPTTVLTVCRLLTFDVMGFVTDRLTGAQVTQHELGDGTTVLVGREGETVSSSQAADILAGTEVSSSFTDPTTWLPVKG